MTQEDLEQPSPYLRVCDRSRLLDYQKCRRREWWSHEFMGRGLEPDSTSYDLAIGSALHTGVEFMFKEKPEPILNAIEEYRSRVLVASIGHEELIRALLYAYHHTQLPSLLQRFEVLGVEEEMAQPLTPGVRFMGRADARLRERVGDYLSLYSVKSTQEFKQRNLDDAYVDMQGLSEAWLAEKTWGQPIDFIQMHYVLKGQKQKKEELEPEEIPQYKSPLICGYKRVTAAGSVEYAHSYFYTCSEPHKMFSAKGKFTGECQGGRNHRLTDDWQPFWVWEEMGSQEWLRMIQAGELTQPSGTLLEDQFALAPPISRQPHEMVRWYRTTLSLAAEIGTGSRLCNETLRSNPSQMEQMLDLFFPIDMTGDECNNHFGRRCQFFDLCHREGADDPLSHGFRWRTFNHPLEATLQPPSLSEGGEEVEDESV